MQKDIKAINRSEPPNDVIVLFISTPSIELTKLPNSRIVKALIITNKQPKDRGFQRIHPTVIATNSKPVMALIKKLFFKVNSN